METLTQSLRDIGMLVLGGVVTWFVTHWRPRQIRSDMHDEYQNKTIEIQGRTLADAWAMIEKQDGRIRDMEKRYENVFAYLLANIDHMMDHDLRPLPVPDNLKSDPELIRLVNRMKDRNEL